MDLLQDYNLVPTYKLKVYVMAANEIQSIFEDIIEKKTGVSTELFIGCYDEYNTDVYVRLSHSYGQSLSDKDLEKLNEFINTEEWFVTRDILQEELFGTNVWSEYEEDEDVFTFNVKVSDDV